MKMWVIGLDCAAPELLLGMDELTTIRHLMAAGCYGRLRSVVPPITVPAWMCMATSQDPGSLGVYGFRNRAAHDYTKLKTVDARSFDQLTIWDQVARVGGRSLLLGVPPSFPPRRINGVRVGCFLTPDTKTMVYTHPPEIGRRITELVGDYPVDVKGFRTPDKSWLRDEVLTMSRKHFAVARDLLALERWDYVQLVEIGLDRIHHGFWQHHDPEHRDYVAGNPYAEVIRDYYRYLDGELASLLELADDDTVVCVMSDHGARRLDGGFCINEWLIAEGLLVLAQPMPTVPTPLEQLAVDWSRTTCWSEGGYYARVFLNIAGREPQGLIAAEQAVAVRERLAEKLAALGDEQGRPLGSRVFRPELSYRQVQGIAPDLIVYLGDLAWRSIGGVGYGRFHVRENDTGPDACNHAEFGAFILAGPGIEPAGELVDVEILDIAPTLLELAGHEIPPSMQGRSLVRQMAGAPAEAAAPDAVGEAVIRERLRGLGYAP
jgi:predicted AlkP superfamily phosphohydrolase/phosphomutase